MPLVKGGKIVDDSFVKLAVDTPLPEGGDILVPAERFIAEADDLLKRAGKVGVIWPNNRDIDELVPYLGKVATVALVFPTFRDGRAYSQARLLRERHGFDGELRATGQVLRDQFVFMIRAGFDAFEVKKDSDALAFEETIKRYSVFYQPTADGRFTALRQRLFRPYAAAAR